MRKDQGLGADAYADECHVGYYDQLQWSCLYECNVDNVVDCAGADQRVRSLA